jgi:hypothetical protein
MREMQNGKPGWKAVFTIVEKRNDPKKNYWMRIGTAFLNKDGSWNVDLSALPVNGKIQLRDPDPYDPNRKRNERHALDPAEGNETFEPLLPPPPVMQ